MCETNTVNKPQNNNKDFILNQTEYHDYDEDGNRWISYESLGVFTSEEEAKSAHEQIKERIKKFNDELNTNPILDKNGKNILKFLKIQKEPNINIEILENPITTDYIIK